MNSSQAIGQQLCKALGIDSQHVTRIMLVCDAKEQARVFVDSLVPDTATNTLAHAARGYELHQLGAEPAEPTEEW